MKHKNALDIIRAALRVAAHEGAISQEECDNALEDVENTFQLVDAIPSKDIPARFPDRRALGEGVPVASAPTLRQLTRRLRELHEAFAHPDGGGEFVSMVRTYNPSDLDHDWTVWVGDTYDHTAAGREYIPGDGLPFDAVAAARRLLAAVRDHCDVEGK